ncbi:hypothetical protein ARAM_002155 [Aspergillus rambellii]|uniref:DUF7730 domain-containing protein n=1 Tax=Aspergillus rambellii TaxID=308745 RepID=A0A0F8X0Y6_9EURO|nr:hypothetical protein ARAM_002155 [Aspergillus rambellii]
MSVKQIRTDYSESVSETIGSCDEDPTPLRPSYFLAFPREIRYIIYSYVFSVSSSQLELIHVAIEKNPSGPRLHMGPGHDNKPPVKLQYTLTPGIQLPVALLRANSQIYREALPVLYSGIIFTFRSNPASLTYLFDRLSDHARHSVRYLQLRPVPLFVDRVKPLGEQLSWAVLCAQIARLPALRRVSVLYPSTKDLESKTVEFHYQRYGKWLALIKVEKEPVFENENCSQSEMERFHRRFLDIVKPPAQDAAGSEDSKWT